MKDFKQYIRPPGREIRTQNLPNKK